MLISYGASYSRKIGERGKGGENGYQESVISILHGQSLTLQGFGRGHKNFISGGEKKVSSASVFLWLKVIPVS